MKKIYVFIFIVFCFNTEILNAQFTVLHNFNDTLGAEPYGDVTIAGKMLYGMTYIGGSMGEGCIFSLDTNGNNYKDIYNFNITNGAEPFGDVMLLGNRLFGMTSSGPNPCGSIFSVDTDGSNYRDLYDFISGTKGCDPDGSLTLYRGVFYGTTASGGLNNAGNIFSIDTNGTGYKDLFDFNVADGEYPCGNITIVGGVLYGTTLDGGANDSGCIFSIDTNGNRYRDLLDFNGTNGRNPNRSLTLFGNKLFGMTYFGGANHDGCVFSIDTNGTGYKDLLDFNGTNGAYPLGDLIISGNRLYGMAQEGLIGPGVIFSIDTSGGQYKYLFNFDGINGANAIGSLTLSGSEFYGMTNTGGTMGVGNIFKIDTSAVTSINNLTETKGSINLFPNPSTGIFTVSCHSESGLRRDEESLPIINIYNMLGEKVLTETLRSTQGDNRIDLSNHPNGIYLYRVLNDDGSLLGEGKLVIQK